MLWVVWGCLLLFSILILLCSWTPDRPLGSMGPFDFSISISILALILCGPAIPLVVLRYTSKIQFFKNANQFFLELKKPNWFVTICTLYFVACLLAACLEIAGRYKPKHVPFAFAFCYTPLLVLSVYIHHGPAIAKLFEAAGAFFRGEVGSLGLTTVLANISTILACIGVPAMIPLIVGKLRNRIEKKQNMGKGAQNKDDEDLSCEMQK